MKKGVLNTKRKEKKRKNSVSMKFYLINGVVKKHEWYKKLKK